MAVRTVSHQRRRVLRSKLVNTCEALRAMADNQYELFSLFEAGMISPKQWKGFQSPVVYEDRTLPGCRQQWGALSTENLKTMIKPTKPVYFFLFY